MSTTNYTDLGYIEEVTPGVTPASPAFTLLPINSVGLIEAIATEVSNRIRSDRMVDDLVPVDTDIGGDNDYELTYKSYRPMMISLLQCGKNSVAPPVAISGATDISADASGLFDSSTTDFVASNVVVGQWLKVSGFTNSENNGMHRVVSVSANQILVDTNLSTLVTEAAGNAIDMEGETYRNSNLPPENYTFKQAVEVDGTPYYAYYRGQQVNTMSFNLETGTLVTGVMGLIGLTGVAQDTTIPGEQPDVPYTEERIMSASNNVAVKLSGIPATTVYETFNLTVNNNINPKKGIGKMGAYGLGSFTNEITAEVEMYFEDLSSYNLFKASTSFLSAFQLTDGEGNIMMITIPASKFETLEMPVPGKDEFLMQSGTIRGVRDAVTNCQIQFDFIPIT